MALLLSAGCGSDEKPLAETFPVSGTVIFNDQPLANATVTFDGGGTNRGAYGMTDEEGRYRLTTFKSGDGAVPATHRVSILHEVEVPDADNGMNEDQYGGQIVEPPKTESTIPDIYSSFDTSPLTAEVKAEENTIDLLVVN